MALWDKLSTRGNVEDRRSAGPGMITGISGIGMLAVLLLTLLGGGGEGVNDILSQLQDMQGSSTSQESGEYAGEDSYERFASTVLGSNNEVWSNQMDGYQEPRLVLFRSATRSACGVATSAVGPHYCPVDKTIYLDETFFEALTNQLGARGGDVAEAYVISHEVGHHVQNLLGELTALEQGDNQRMIDMELQADCYAGVWANVVNQQGIFEEGEIEEAIDAAGTVGDDRIQEKTQGQVNPETWTHGSSEQRMGAFNQGYQTGQISSCQAS